jgi:PAS domain S-box-containing protein
LVIDGGEMDDISQITGDLSLESFAQDYCRLAVEACPNGMVMTDSGGRIVLANAETERLFGYRRDELIGRTIEILLPERLRNGHLQRRAAFAHRPEPRSLGEGRNLLGRRRDGNEIPLEIGLYPIRSDQGLLVLAVIVDISERKRADRLKDEFVSTVSHELRTPLTSIAGSLGLLTGGAAGTLPEPAARLIRIAQSNSQRLVRLINDILDIEKIESGQVAFKFKRLSVRSLVEQVIEANRGYADGFRIRVRLDADATAGEVYADPDRLAQVITNLLSNAIKFSPPGDEVAVTITEHDETVRVAVRDHGQGIPHEFRPRIFEKFAQADATDARQKGGTGLGLSIVKQIVTRLGGAVGFEDAAGAGTVFYVVLPGWTQVAAGAIDPEASLHAARILFCEDNLDTAFAVRYGLRQLGFTTDFAHSPADAISRTQATHYDAVLVDLDLPDGDGVGLIRALRAEPKIYKTPIVVISADGSLDKAGLQTPLLNVLECMQKPVDIDRLAQILDRAIRRNANGRPQILHVDDDYDVLEMVAETLDSTASIVSVDSLEEARCALLLPIPVIVFSAHGTELKGELQVEAQLDKSSAASLKDLLAAVHDRLMLRPAPTYKEAL